MLICQFPAAHIGTPELTDKAPDDEMTSSPGWVRGPNCAPTTQLPCSKKLTTLDNAADQTLILQSIDGKGELAYAPGVTSRPAKSARGTPGPGITNWYEPIL
jgi:hypothetical protein